MTLVVALQTELYIVMAADGMAFRQEADSHVPYPAQKLHLANKNWVIGTCGWDMEVHRKQLEAEIECGKQGFGPDLDIGGPEYLKAMHAKLTGESLPQGNVKIILAGFGSAGPTVKVAELSPRTDGSWAYSLQEAPRVAAFGSQSATAKWILNTFVQCCRTPEDYTDLACFAIWQVAQQELTQGQFPRYALSTATLEVNSRGPNIQTHIGEPLLSRLHARLERLKEAYRNS